MKIILDVGAGNQKVIWVFLDTIDEAHVFKD